MVSWLYGLLLGLGIASLVLSLLSFSTGLTLRVTAEDSKWKKILGIVLLSFLPVLIIAGIVLISVCENVGKI